MIGDRPPGQGAARRVREGRRRQRRAVLGAAFAAVLGLGAALAWLRPWAVAPESIPEVPAEESAPAAPRPSPGAGLRLPAPEPEVPAAELPALEASDAFVRERAAAASPLAEWGAWLGGEGLVARFVAAVDAVAHGESPRDDLPELTPRGPFRVLVQGPQTLIASESYARYDAATAVFASLDAALCARLHRELRPLFDAALAELGGSELRFDALLARAFQELLAVAIPGGAIEVVAKVKSYEYADPALETLSPAQKQLLRLGPVNARRVQEKVRELENALGLVAAPAAE
jgi:hypothetical protein